MSTKCIIHTAYWSFNMCVGVLKAKAKNVIR